MLLDLIHPWDVVEAFRRARRDAASTDPSAEQDSLTKKRMIVDGNFRFRPAPAVSHEWRDAHDRTRTVSTR